MSKYPSLSAGIIPVSSLQAMIEDVTVKTTSTDRTSTATVADDPDLSGIALGIGTWKVDVLIFATTPVGGTQKFKTQWGFTGTWNTPIRACVGPGSTNTAVRSDITPSQFDGMPSNSDCTYGLAASTGFNVITERCDFVVVTVAGNFSLKWSQATSSANLTSLKSGSSVTVRQIA